MNRTGGFGKVALFCAVCVSIGIDYVIVERCVLSGVFNGFSIA